LNNEEIDFLLPLRPLPGMRRATGWSWVCQGSYKAEAEMPGFESVATTSTTTKNQPALYNFSLHVGAVSETVEVVAQSAGVQTGSASVAGAHGRMLKQPQLAPGAASSTASENALNLQKHVAGVLPVPLDLPRCRNLVQFWRPLLLDEETRVTFSHRSRQRDPPRNNGRGERLPVPLPQCMA